MLMLAAALTFTFGTTEANAGHGIPGILIPPGLPGSAVNVHADGSCLRPRE